MTIGVAFFDLDHTLLNVNSSFRFGIYLYREKVINLSCLANLLWNYFLHKCGRLDIYGIHEKSFKSLFCSREKNEFQYHAKRFVDEVYACLINNEVLSLLHLKKQKGDKVVILSSSPDFLVECFAEKMGVDGWRATVYQANNVGKYVSIDCVLEGKEKAKLVNEISVSYQIPKNLTSGYSDSHHDLDFLRSVAQPVAVNPNKILRRISINEGWDILDT